MSVVAGALLVVAVAAAIALPLLPGREPASAEGDARDDAELLEREKSVALMAIKEADFDRAMGKLSEEDYASLRGQYEERALGALSALDDLATSSPPGAPAGGTVSAAPATFCTGCGRRFRSEDRFCSGCGSARFQ